MRSSRDDPPGTAPPRCHLLDALPPISECTGATGKPLVPAPVHAMIVAARRLGGLGETRLTAVMQAGWDARTPCCHDRCPNGRERALAIKDDHDARSAADGDRSSGGGIRARCELARCELVRVTGVDSQPLTAAERMRRSRARRRGDPTLLRQGVPGRSRRRHLPSAMWPSNAALIEAAACLYIADSAVVG